MKVPGVQGPEGGTGEDEGAEGVDDERVVEGDAEVARVVGGDGEMVRVVDGNAEVARVVDGDGEVVRVLYVVVVVIVEYVELVWRAMMRLDAVVVEVGSMLEVLTGDVGDGVTDGVGEAVAVTVPVSVDKMLSNVGCDVVVYMPLLLR